jgi:hypothetical protein
MGQPSRVVKAFFYSRADAKRCSEQLGVLFETTEPEVSPQVVNGRSWFMTITIPQGLRLSTMYVDPTLLGQIDAAILHFNGTTQEPVAH